MSRKQWRENWVNKILEAGNSREALAILVDMIYEDGLADGFADGLEEEYNPRRTFWEDQD